VITGLWIGATVAGFVIGGLALHSPGASGIGTSYVDWDVSAAIFGAVLGSIVGAWTGAFQNVALRRRNARIVVASVVLVAVAHALADGAPAAWGVPVVAAISGLVGAVAFAWAIDERNPRAVILWAAAWPIGWGSGVAVAGVLGLSGSGDPGTWALEHLVIAIPLGLAWGGATSPAMRRVLLGLVQLRIE
jgi:hypothetical protein